MPAACNSLALHNDCDRVVDAPDTPERIRFPVAFPITASGIPMKAIPADPTFEVTESEEELPAQITVGVAETTVVFPAR